MPKQGHRHRASGLEPQKLIEAEVRECVPNARTAFGRGVCRILGEESRDRLMVAEQCGRVNIAACDFGMRGEDFRELSAGCFEKWC